MIPIVAKNKESFSAICKFFSISESEATFIDSTIREPEPAECSPPIYDMNLKRDGSDWIAY
jgi:hypothetical protein